MTTLRFPVWYYGGPFLTLAEPDRDLPRRDPTVQVPEDVRARVEFSGSLRGERIIAPFGDANGAEAILGLLFLAEGYPESWAEDERSVFPTIQGLLAGVRDRLKEKVSRAKGPRRAWLVEAVSCAERAAAAFSAGRYADGAAVARECAEYIRGAGRTRHQTAPIILGPGNEHGSE